MAQGRRPLARDALMSCQLPFTLAIVACCCMSAYSLSSAWPTGAQPCWCTSEATFVVMLTRNKPLAVTPAALSRGSENEAGRFWGDGQGRPGDLGLM
jgi:hypothetical protein